MARVLSWILNQHTSISTTKPPRPWNPILAWTPLRRLGQITPPRRQAANQKPAKAPMPTVKVPAVIGNVLADARVKLEGQGFTVSTLNVVDPANVGVVVDQSPAADTLAAPKSNVVLTIGIAGPATTVTTTTLPGP